jgi:dinuclear metal center YbgI/SA1388 family protein
MSVMAGAVHKAVVRCNLAPMQLSDLLSCLRAVAPEPLAEDWDAVGLHIGWQNQTVERALLCIDLTEPVLAEACEQGVNLIVAYHPPIFKPLASITDDQPRGRILLEAIRRGMAIYSPHTALDSAAGGVNDFLADGLSPDQRWPIRPVAAESLGGLHEELPTAAQNAGQGRVLTFHEPLTLDQLTGRLKQCLGMDRIHVGPADSPDSAAPGNQPIHRLALCPGAGASLMPEAGEIQAFITGEMRHHDQLAAKAAGTAVLLPGHSETERPYLPTYRQRLIDAGGEIDWLVSEVDRAPTVLA